MNKVSIIIPAYNAEKHIKPCLDSILAQNYAQWEAIVIDDGSTDTTSAICQQYAANDNRIIYLRQCNQGVSKARNMGIEVATGKFITFIDADDWIESDYVEALLSVRQDSFQITYIGISMDYIKDTIHKTENIIPNEGKVLHLGATCGKLYDAQLIKQNHILFNESLTLHEDHVFYYNCLLHAKSLRCISKIGYHYMHYGEASLSRRLQSSSAYFLSAQKLLEYYPKDKTCCDKFYKSFCIQKFGLNQIIMGIFSSYFENNTCKKRIEIIKYQLHYRRQFSDHYKTNSLNGIFFYFTFMYFPACIQDLIYKTMVLLFGSRLKKSLNIS